MATISILLKTLVSNYYQINASLVVLIIIIGIITLKWYTSPKVIKNLPPSPPKFPVIGNLHQLGLSPHRSLKSLSEKHGPLMLLHLGNKPLLVVSSAKAACEVLKTHDIAFSGRPKTKFPGRLLYDYRDIAFAPYGDYWRQVRSICVLQLLSNKRVQSFRCVVEQEVACMMSKVGGQGCETSPPSSSSVLNFDDLFSTLTYDVVCMVAFGKKYSSEEGGSKFKSLFHELTDLLGVFNVGDYIPCLEWINYLNGLEAKVKRVAQDFDRYLDHIVQENMDYNRQQGGKEADNFVQVLLQIQKNNDTGFTVDLDIIKALVLDMLVAGTDTTYTLLQWAMAELIRHRDKLLKLQDEVRNIVGVGNKPPAAAAVITDQEISEMHYLKAVIKETLRLHPPLPLMIPHESQHKVNMMGYEIDKGTQVMVNVWAIGRDPCSWGEDALEFKPERFLNSSTSTSGGSVVDYMYIPFGSGRRSCPGSTFALGTVEFALASLMNGFNFELPHGFDPIHMDMSESSGITAHRKTPLVLVATTPPHPTPPHPTLN